MMHICIAFLFVIPYRYFSLVYILKRVGEILRFDLVVFFLTKEKFSFKHKMFSVNERHYNTRKMKLLVKRKSCIVLDIENIKKKEHENKNKKRFRSNKKKTRKEKENNIKSKYESEQHCHFTKL